MIRPTRIGRTSNLRHLSVRAALIFATAAPLPALADEILVAVATNYAKPAEEIAAGFEAATGHTVTLTSGATGKFYAQISEGAPFDILLSADASTPARLETEGKAVPGSRFTYATGQLALWSADPARDLTDPVAALTAGGVVHIAIANPDIAPYGKAAQETLEKMGIWDAVQPRIVLGENIGQAHAMTATGAAEVGFVAMSTLIAEPGGAAWPVPADMHAPITQDAVLLLPGDGDAAAIAFLDYLRGDAARLVTERFGYDMN